MKTKTNSKRNKVIILLTALIAFGSLSLVKAKKMRHHKLHSIEQSEEFKNMDRKAKHEYMRQHKKDAKAKQKLNHEQKRKQKQQQKDIKTS